ncbi:hypothetical protein ACEQ8H_002076 [Pleosporales sp. CAS-2024a]
MAANRPTTRRRSVKQAFEDDEAPAPKRPRTELNSTAKKPAAAKKAAKAAYDEDDDGFQFSRRTSKRSTKAQAAQAPEPILEEPSARDAQSQEPLPAKPTTRRKKTTTTVVDVQMPDPNKRRRSTRLSAGKDQLQVRPKATEPSAAKLVKKSAPVEKERKKQMTPAPEAHTEAKSALVGAKTPTQNELTVAKKRDPNAQRIMLPFADTPVINRNKEMRKGSKEGQRRSSTGLRGRRASSLIDSGMSNALPHSEVEVRDFYKYIEQSLPEPRRMKQLLTWCGSRALPEKPSGNVKNANAIMAARAIQQELIDDFANKPELSDWFSREETAAPTVIKKPNPQNEKNKATLEELEEEVDRLEKEKAEWEALAAVSKSKCPRQAPTKPLAIPLLSEIDTSLLDPDQAAIVSALQVPDQAAPSQTEEASEQRPPSGAFTFTTRSALQSRLTKLSQSLEPQIDLFADGVHKIEQYRQTAGRVADRILSTASKRLEERDRDIKARVGAEGIGVGDILRGLAGVLGEQS